jgi:hypothetical protein
MCEAIAALAVRQHPYASSGRKKILFVADAESDLSSRQGVA